MVEDFALLLNLGDGEFCDGEFCSGGSASFTSFLSSQGRSRAVMVSPVSIPTASLKCCSHREQRAERKEGERIGGKRARRRKRVGGKVGGREGGRGE